MMLFSIDISNQQCEECRTCQKFQGVASGIRKSKLSQIFICERDYIIFSHVNGLCLSGQVCICGSFVCKCFVVTVSTRIRTAIITDIVCLRSFDNFFVTGGPYVTTLVSEPSLKVPPLAW